MRKSNAIRLLTPIIAAIFLQQAATAGPEEDRLAFIAFYQARFPDIPVAEYANGIYAIDSDARKQWLDIEDFPPYEFTIDAGATLWQEVFADGRTYADCFTQQTGDIRPLYPLFDDDSDEVVTLALAINNCRTLHEQSPLAYDGPEVTSITAYLAFEARGNRLDIRVGDAGALAAYEAGKRFYYTKRGQLNFACSDCHGISAGQYVRADRLSAGLGHPTHFPVYRSKTGGMVSLHERFYDCVRDVRATPFELQSIEFRNLEYFLTYMSNGFEVNGPGSRK